MWLPISNHSNRTVNPSEEKTGRAKETRPQIIFPNRIAMLRRTRRPIVRQRALAKVLHLSDRHVRRIERGTARASEAVLETISKVLGVGVVDLVAKPGRKT